MRQTPFRDLAPRLARTVGLGAALLLAAPQVHAQEARFEVSGQAVTPPLMPMTATLSIAGSGVGLLAEGFEPGIYRTWFLARADARDRVSAALQDLSAWDMLRPGALDGAEVEVLRIEDGRFRQVRVDRVAPGGHLAAGWTDALPSGQALAPGAREATIDWPRGWRPNAPTWFMVQAVAADGTRSAPSAAVRIDSPDAPGEAGELTPTVDFAPDRAARSGEPGPALDLQVRRGPGGSATLVWRAEGAAPAAWTVSRASAPPEAFGSELRLEGEGPPIRAGDLVVVRKRFDDLDPAEFLADRIWTLETGLGARMRPGVLSFWSGERPGVRWRLVPHAPGDAVEGGGRSFLRVDLDPGARVEIGRYNHGPASQSWYPVLTPDPYRISFRARSPAPATGRVTFTGFYAREIEPVPFETGPEWREISLDVRRTAPLPADAPIGRVQLEFDGPAQVDLDALRMRPADEEFFQLPPMRARQLREAGLSFLRYHAFIKTGRSTYDLAALTDAPGTPSGVPGRNTLPQMLEITRRAGLDPWLQIEPHFTPQEWQGLVEYLAAPAGPDAPWAAKRAALGREAPGTDAFDRILIEIGNETWNGLFAPWTYPEMTDAASGRAYSRGEVYGIHQEHVIGILRASPWWRAAGLDDKVEFVIGGWIRQSYGADAAARSPSSRYMTVGAYNGGWDENEGPPDGSKPSFFSVLNQAAQVAIPNAEQHAAEARRLSRVREPAVLPGTYEAGPGYALNGLNGARVSREQYAAQERVMKSQAAGVATLDGFLAMARAGFAIQNFFTFNPGETWSSHAIDRNGGQAYPSWKLITLLNHEGLGEMLHVRTLAVPTEDLEGGRGMRRDVRNAPQIAVYATRDGDRVNVFVLSRRIPGHPDPEEDGCTPVEIALPFAAAQSLTVHRMAGPYDAHNIESDAVKIERRPLPAPADASRLRVDAATGGEACGMPPASALLYVYEGVRS